MVSVRVIFETAGRVYGVRPYLLMFPVFEDSKTPSL